MTNISTTAEYMLIALHFMTWTLILCSGLLWVERRENPRERKILATTFLIAGGMMLLRLILTYKGNIPASYPVLPLPNLYGGYWALLLVSIYPIEAVAPGWLKWEKLLLLFSPMIIITLILATVPFEFRELYSWSDIVAHINEANVWFRIVLLFVIIIPYMVLLLLVPYNWKQSSVDVKWIRIYTIGAQGISVCYISFMLTGSLTASFVHLTYCTFFFIYVTYQELYLRLLPAASQMPYTTNKEGVSWELELEKKSEIEQNELWTQMETYMQYEEPWRSPNLTVGDVAKAIGVSRSKLSAEISAQGNESFHTLVARYRIAAFCEMVQQGEVDSVNEALFSIGFRSRSTAYDRFKKQMGMTPTEYIKTIKPSI